MTEDDMKAALDRIQHGVGDVISELYISIGPALALRDAILDFDRGLITLPELIRQAKKVD